MLYMYRRVTDSVRLLNNVNQRSKDWHRLIQHDVLIPVFCLSCLLVMSYALDKILNAKAICDNTYLYIVN